MAKTGNSKQGPDKKSSSGRRLKRAGILPFGGLNYALIGLGVLFIVIGFVSLGMGSITFAPIMLVLAYCVIIPIAIMVKGKRSREEQ